MCAFLQNVPNLLWKYECKVIVLFHERALHEISLDEPFPHGGFGSLHQQRNRKIYLYLNGLRFIIRANAVFLFSD